MMNVSDAGLKFLSEQEGCRLKRYKDVAGLDTIGVGHLITGKEMPPIGDCITQDRCLELLREDVKSVVDEFNDNDGFADLPSDITQDEFDACVSLAFNIGIGAFDHSTVLKMIEQHNFPAAGNAFLLWNKAGGKVVQGLVNRRNEERELFLKG